MGGTTLVLSALLLVEKLERGLGIWEGEALDGLVGEDMFL